MCFTYFTILFFFIFFLICFSFFFFFNDTATTEIYTLSLHDALPILLVALVGFWECRSALLMAMCIPITLAMTFGLMRLVDRKSTRLNSSHSQISYAVFCLKKKKKKTKKIVKMTNKTYNEETVNY